MFVLGSRTQFNCNCIQLSVNWNAGHLSDLSPCHGRGWRGGERTCSPRKSPTWVCTWPGNVMKCPDLQWFTCHWHAISGQTFAIFVSQPSSAQLQAAGLRSRWVRQRPAFPSQRGAQWGGRRSAPMVTMDVCQKGCWCWSQNVSEWIDSILSDTVWWILTHMDTKSEVQH